MGQQQDHAECVWVGGGTGGGGRGGKKGGVVKGIHKERHAENQRPERAQEHTHKNKIQRPGVDTAELRGATHPGGAQMPA